MTSAVEMEKRYQILRTQLSDLKYFQPFGNDSVPLVERLLGDLIKTVESYQDILKQNESYAEQVSIFKKEAELARNEQPRLIKENNELHLKLMREGEELDLKSSEYRKKIESLEDANEQYQLLLQQEAFNQAKVEAENANLRRKLLDIVDLDNQADPSDLFTAVLDMQGTLANIPVYATRNIPVIQEFEEFNHTLANENGRLRRVVDDQTRQIDRLINKSKELETERDRLASITLTHVPGEKQALIDPTTLADLRNKDKVIGQLTAKLDYLNDRYEEAKRRLTIDTTAEYRQKLEQADDQIKLLKADVNRYHELLAAKNAVPLDVLDEVKVESGSAQLQLALDRELRLRQSAERKVKSLEDSLRTTAPQTVPSSDNSALHAKISGLTKELEVERLAVASLTRRLTSSGGPGNSKVPADDSELRKLLQVKNSELQQLLAENRSLQDTLNALLASSEVSTAPPDLASAIDRLAQENSSLRQRINALETALSAAARRADEVEKFSRASNLADIDAETRLRRAESAAQEAELRVREAEEMVMHMEEALAKSDGDKMRLTRELENSKSELLARVNDFESAITNIQSQIVVTAEENKELTLQVSIMEAERRSNMEIVNGATTQLTDLSAACEALSAENQALQEQLALLGSERDDLSHDLSQTLSHAHSLTIELRTKTEALGSVEGSTEAVRRDLRIEVSAKLAALKESEEAKARVAVAEDQLISLTQQLGQVKTLAEQLNSAREQLAIQLTVTQRDLEEERRNSKSNLERQQTSTSEIVGMEGEISQLKEALVRLDADRDSLQRLADHQAEKLDELVRENRRLNIDSSESARSLENTRRGTENAERALDDLHDTRKSLERRLTDAMAEGVALAEQLGQARRDLADAADDVATLSRDNQRIHDQLSDAIKSAEGAGNLARLKDRNAQELLQALRATEIERDDILELYRKVADEVNRKEMLIAQGESEKIGMEQVAHDLQKQLEDAIRAEEQARQKHRQAELDIVALRRSVTELMAKLEMNASETDEGRKALQKTLVDLRYSQEVTRQVEAHREAFERETALLANQNENLITDLQKLQQELTAQRNAVLLEGERREALERLIGQLRQQQVTSREELTPVSRQDGDVEQLYKTIEQQYELIGEMDAELERLRSQMQ